MKTIAEIKVEQDIPVIVADSEGVVTYINPAFTEAYGWTNELVGQPLSFIIPGNMHDAHNLGFSRYLMTETPRILSQAIDLFVICKDGQQVNATHFIISEKIEGQWFFAATIAPL